MKLEISIGEAIDKLSILELKLLKIKDEKAIIEIKKEINEYTECSIHKEDYHYELYYNLLMFINEKIWDFTDIIKTKNIDENSSIDDFKEFSIISSKIFELNQQRFRIKNWFNILSGCSIKEQKSYSKSYCSIIINNEDIIFDKICEINFLSFNYDLITFECSDYCNIILKRIFKIPTIIFNNDEKILLQQPSKIINIANFSIDTIYIDKDILSFKPIKYLAGGMFGDFIHSLSVVCEKYRETGRKGIIYLSVFGDGFRNGLDNTYNDTYPVLIEQNYIYDYKIINNEFIDINLTRWRQNPQLFKQNWYNTFKQTYSINWGSHIWLNVKYDNKWENKIVINTTHYRWVELDFVKLSQMYPDNIVFISNDIKQKLFFENKTGITINEYYEFKTFDELTTIINSCKLFVGSPSGPLAVAMALNKDRIVGKIQTLDDLLNGNMEYIFKGKIRYEV